MADYYGAIIDKMADEIRKQRAEIERLKEELAGVNAHNNLLEINAEVDNALIEKLNKERDFWHEKCEGYAVMEEGYPRPFQGKEG